jgi:hypothetical protein
MDFPRQRVSRKRAFALAIALAGISLTPPVSAHHSASRFDLSIRDNRVSGIVKEFNAANPHTKIVLEVTDEKGTRDIEYEGHSHNNYYRAGWRVGAVNPGDEITLIAAPTRDGTDGGYALGVITQDGVRF